MSKPLVAGRGFIDPFQDRELLRYFTRLREWHGFLRFIGLSAIWDTPDLAIERLFVAPRLSDQLIAPQANPESLSGSHDCYAFLAKHPFLVVLGDPGSGKSTLVSWIVNRLTYEADDGLVSAIGRVIPFPFVLRELELDSIDGWDDLWNAFTKHGVAENLHKVDCNALLSSGQAIVLL
ncbi:MAG: hypothetical protein EOP06_23095, partial [Proteobacteria bacterium]